MYKVVSNLLMGAATVVVLSEVIALGGEPQSDRRASERLYAHAPYGGTQFWLGEDGEDGEDDAFAFAADCDTDTLNPTCTSQQTVLGASLIDSDVDSADVGTAIYRTWTVDGVANAEVKLRIQGAAPNTSLTATVADVDGNVIATIGTITTDANGNAYEEFAAVVNPRKTDEAALPADFPTLTSGESIAVGTLSGQFSTTLPQPLSPPRRHVLDTVLHAQLVDSDVNSADVGTAIYRTWTIDGVANAKVKLRIQGAAPNTSLTATVADVDETLSPPLGPLLPTPMGMRTKNLPLW